MKKAFQILSSMLIAVAFVAAALWGIYSLLANAIAVFATLNPSLAVPLCAAMATILVSVGSLVIGKHLEHKQALIVELRKKKVPVYEVLIKLIFKIIYQKKDNEALTSESEEIQSLIEVVRDLIVWGSDDVINEYRNFKANLGKKTPSETAFSVEKILLAIRVDLGHKNKNFAKGHLLGMFVNDIDEIIAKEKLRQISEKDKGVS